MAPQRVIIHAGRIGLRWGFLQQAKLRRPHPYNEGRTGAGLSVRRAGKRDIWVICRGELRW